jgi:hypothetical protein
MLSHCTRASIVNNLFLFNNYDYRYGALKVVVDAASQQSDQFQLVISENNFTLNQGDFSVAHICERD